MYHLHLNPAIQSSNYQLTLPRSEGLKVIELRLSNSLAECSHVLLLRVSL